MLSHIFCHFWSSPGNPDFYHWEMLPPSTLMFLSPIHLHILLQQDMHLYSLYICCETQCSDENAVVSLRWGVNLGGTISQKMYNGHKQTLVGIDNRQLPQSATEQCPIVVWLWGHKLLNSTHTLYYSTLSNSLLMVTNRRFCTIFSQYYY